MRGRGPAGVLAVLAILFASGYLAVGAVGRAAADSPLIVLDQSIGGVSIGMSQDQVESLYGTPDSSQAIVLRGGGTGLLVTYHVHGAELIVVFAGDRVVSIETNSSFYRTDAGIGPGTSKAGLHGFHEDFCSGGLWDGNADLPADGVVTVFQRDGDEVASVTITELGYYDLCQSEGTNQNVKDPRPPKSQLDVDVQPQGAGYVQSGGLEIDCPYECSKEFDTDATITLTAHPTNGFTFAGWSGACSGTGACVVTLDGSKHVTALFEGHYVPQETTTTTKKPPGPPPCTNPYGCGTQ